MSSWGFTSQPTASAPASAPAFSFGSSNLAPPAENPQATSTNANSNSNFGFGSATVSQPFSFGPSATAPPFSSSHQPASFFSSFSQPTPSSTSQPSSSLFSWSQPAAPSMPQIASTPAPFPRDTRVEELPQNVRQSLEQLEKTMREHQAALMAVSIPVLIRSDDADSKGPESTIDELQEALQACQAGLAALRKRQNALWRSAESAAAYLASTRATIGEDERNKRVVFRIRPTPSSYTSPPFVDLSTVIGQLNDQFGVLKRRADTLRRQWQTTGKAPAPGADKLASLKNTLVSQDRSLKALQDRVKTVRAGIATEKDKYVRFLEKYRHLYNVDPFQGK